MFAEPATIRGRARALRRRADEIHDLADHLVRLADEAAWQGLGADAMRAATRHSAGGLRRTATLHEDAAEALDRHAHRVGVVHDALDGAVHALSHALGALG
ncbi:hypothetical protein P5P86_02710 [Nocardioides sp. BP30]|uniref:hypothetical protein n=1 Tax=Nocardioides sp. BP30 TaxID=3036374 RepID=UPI00246895CB|nr:hypothetical protein [Nocardioides sp. BP30]WGL52744.1 hypothetical protein P5P86_02710 [Nocardioides sp. BP30]